MSNHLLDQVSSHAMSRVAAARGLELAVTPAGEEAVRPPRQSWTRWLPYLFFLLSLIALGGMLLGAANLADDGWSVSDAVQLALMALLVGGVVQQARMMVRATPAGRWLTRSKPKPSSSAGGLAAPVCLLDMVRAEDLVALRPAVAPSARLHQQARRKGGALSGRAAVLVVVALSFLAFLGMCFVCGYVAWVAGPWDPGLWLTLPFTALTGFGAWQVFRSARRAAFRGRPWTLLSRAFRDSVRVWGSGSLAMHVLVTATATASITGAALAPVVQGVPAPFDLFAVDSATGAAYRVDIDTLTGVQLTDTPERLRFAGLGATAANVTLSNGVKLPRGSIVGVVESPAGAQGLVAFRPGSREALPGPRITPALPGASFAGGTGGMFALQPDGALWRVDQATGAATRIGQTSAPFGPMTFDGASRQLVLFSEGAVWRVDAASGAVVSTSVVQPAVQGCGIARAGKDVFFVAEAGTGRLLLVNTKEGTAREVIVTGEFPDRPCLITTARRD